MFISGLRKSVNQSSVDTHAWTLSVFHHKLILNAILPSKPLIFTIWFVLHFNITWSLEKIQIHCKYSKQFENTYLWLITFSWVILQYLNVLSCKSQFHLLLIFSFQFSDQFRRYQHLKLCAQKWSARLMVHWRLFSIKKEKRKLGRLESEQIENFIWKFSLFLFSNAWRVIF